MGLDLLISGLLSKYLTDVVKWLADKGNIEIPNIAKKIVAFILSALTTYVAKLHLPIDMGSIQALQPVLTSVVVAGLSYALHDLLEWLAKVADNLQPKPATVQPQKAAAT
jgi:hypothetical protein